jgi:hypothetical protein
MHTECCRLQMVVAVMGDIFVSARLHYRVGRIRAVSQVQTGRPSLSM